MAKFVPHNEVSLYRGSLFIYFSITVVKKIVRYTKDFVVSRFHCILIHLSKRKEKKKKEVASRIVRAWKTGRNVDLDGTRAFAERFIIIISG